MNFQHEGPSESQQREAPSSIPGHAVRDLGDIGHLLKRSKLKVLLHRVSGAETTYLRLKNIRNQNYDCYLVVSRFPAELGPVTRSNRSGSKNGAERTQN